MKPFITLKLFKSQRFKNRGLTIKVNPHLYHFRIRVTDPYDTLDTLFHEFCHFVIYAAPYIITDSQKDLKLATTSEEKVCKEIARKSVRTLSKYLVKRNFKKKVK